MGVPNHQPTLKRPSFRQAAVALSIWGLLAWALWSPSVLRAEDFGDISVAPQMLHDGNTQHGYAETRVLLQNRSTTKTHRVKLSFPNEPARYGGSQLSAITLTVTLAPGDRVLKTLWQPPLPVNGDCRLRVEVDNENPELVNFPGGNHHVSGSGRAYGAMMPSTVLVSRDLNFDSVSRAFKNDGKSFTAMMAIGAPDSSGRTGNPVITAWMPDPKQPGSNWLELEYNNAFVCDHLRLFQTMAVLQPGELILIGDSGTNLLRLPLSAGKQLTAGSGPPYNRTGRGIGWRTMREFEFVRTAEPVKKVRLEFPASPPDGINIDAVELCGSFGTIYADKATASSDAASEGTRWSTTSIGSGSEQALPLRAEFPVAEWSPNWLAYTPYDVIAITISEMKLLPPDVAEALWRYTEAGGNLFVVGGDESVVPATWRNGWRHGFNRFTSFSVGFGRCFCTPTEDFTRLDMEAAQLLRTTVTGTTRYWATLPSDVDSANTAFPVTETITMPTRGIVLLMLVFILLVGPVNFFLLGWMKRRLWMLWTIPAISLATCGVVFIYSLLREGITPDTRIRSLTVLDQESRRATSIGTEAFYCPLTPSKGLTFDYETEITPLMRVGYGGDAGRTLDLTTAQHLTEGWVAARVPAHFHLRKSETRRERLQIERTGKQLAVINGLGTPVKALWFADTDGALYSASNVGAGDKTVLLPSSQSIVGNGGNPAKLLTDATYIAKNEGVLAEPGKYLKPGCYLAELEGNPFLENGLGKAARPSHTRASTLVYGVMEANP